MHTTGGRWHNLQRMMTLASFSFLSAVDLISHYCPEIAKKIRGILVQWSRQYSRLIEHTYPYCSNTFAISQGMVEAILHRKEVFRFPYPFPKYYLGISMLSSDDGPVTS